VRARDDLETKVLGFVEQSGVDQIADVDEHPSDHGGLEEEDGGGVDVVVLEDLGYCRVQHVPAEGDGQTDQVQGVAQTARPP
jgi:hypothetical protein